VQVSEIAIVMVSAGCEGSKLHGEVR